eukprot:gene18425-24900_t
MHIFVRNLDSCSKSYKIGELATVHDIKQLVEEKEGIPAACLQLEYAGRQLSEEDEYLSRWGVGQDSTLHLLLSLRGGKGGFGALLRGQGRDGKVTTNFDACRDLQGRRVKHTTVENKLAEWKSQAEEREMEKLALKHIKEQARKEHAQKAAVEDVKDAVQTALAASSSKACTKRKPEGSVAPAGKKGKMMALHGLSSDDDDSSDDDKNDEENSSCSRPRKMTQVTTTRAIRRSDKLQAQAQALPDLAPSLAVPDPALSPAVPAPPTATAAPALVRGR